MKLNNFPPIFQTGPLEILSLLVDVPSDLLLLEDAQSIRI
jgi:hypothetical protein